MDTVQFSAPICITENFHEQLFSENSSSSKTLFDCTFIQVSQTKQYRRIVMFLYFPSSTILMDIFNAPKELQELTKLPILNESCSLIHFQVSEGNPDTNNSFIVFINDDVIPLFKELLDKESKIVIFDSNAKLTYLCLNTDNVLLVGLQYWSEQNYSILRSKCVKFYPLKEILIDGKDEVCDAIMSVCKDNKRLHLHIDESVLNSTGLNPRELLYFIQRLRLLKAIKSISLNTKDSNLSLKLMCELF